MFVKELDDSICNSMRDSLKQHPPAPWTELALDFDTTTQIGDGSVRKSESFKYKPTRSKVLLNRLYAHAVMTSDDNAQSVLWKLH